MHKTDTKSVFTVRAASQDVSPKDLSVRKMELNTQRTKCLKITLYARMTPDSSVVPI